MNSQEEYLKIIGEIYDELKQICKDVCGRNKEVYSEDILNDTVIKIYNLIEKKGKLDDMSVDGIKKYFVRSYVNNLRCEKRNSYIKKRDNNITNDEFIQEYDKQHQALITKLTHDLFNDFAILYIMYLVEENFTQEHFYLYRLKTLFKMTYKEINKKTNIPKSKEKILEVQRWVKENIKREDVKKAFDAAYGNLIN